MNKINMFGLIGIAIVLVSMTFYILTLPPPIERGNVIEKIHEPERDWVYMMPITTSTGKTTTTTYIPMFMHDDEDWAIVIENNDQTRMIYLEKEEWDNIREGDWFETEDYISLRNEDKPEKRKATEVEIERYRED